MPSDELQPLRECLLRHAGTVPTVRGSTIIDVDGTIHRKSRVNPMLRLKKGPVNEMAMQRLWLTERRGGSVPTVHESGPGWYTYEWIEGRRAVPDDLPEILEQCERTLWQPPARILRCLDPDLYQMYVEKRLMSPLLHGIWSGVKEVMGCVYPKMKFTPAAYVHGDMTLENIVIAKDDYCHADGSVCFIDPGFDRGLPCVELDLAKLRQSLEEQGAPIPDLMRTKEVELLLMTHYVRLLRHAGKHPQSRLDHARRRVEELCRSL